jgi:hypothetical protein
MVALILFLKGMTGAMAPFSYLVDNSKGNDGGKSPGQIPLGRQAFG